MSSVVSNSSVGWRLKSGKFILHVMPWRSFGWSLLVKVEGADFFGLREDSNTAFPLFSGHILAYFLVMDSLLCGLNCVM